MRTLICLLLATAAIAADLQLGWSRVDIGGAEPAGTSSINGGTMTIAGGGRFNDIDSRANLGRCHFVYQRERGDFVVSVRITAFAQETDKPAGGLMIRSGEGHEDLVAHLGLTNAWEDYLYLSGHRRLGRTGDTKLPVWVRMTRIGDDILAEASADGKVWRRTGSLRHPGLSNDLLLGVYSGSATRSKLHEVTFDSFSIAPTTKGPETSWLANTWALQDLHVPNRVHAMCVAPGGGILLNAADEFCSLWQLRADGQLMPDGGSAHFDFGRAIVADARRITFASGMNTTDDNRRIQVFDYDREVRQEFLRGHHVTGLALSGGTLWVADAQTGHIRRFAGDPWVESGAFEMDEPGALAIDREGALLVVHARSATVTRWSAEGKQLPHTIRLPMGAQPRGIAVHPKDGSVWVCDSGPLQQIHVYSPDGTLRRSIGEAGGVYGGRNPGAVGPDRFDFPTTLAFEPDGSWYVGCGGYTDSGWVRWGSAGTRITAYSADGTQRWEVQGMAFIDNADAMPGSDVTDIHTAEHRYSLDLAKPHGKQATLRAVTMDPFAYPEDPRVKLRTHLPAMRQFGKAKLLTATEPDSARSLSIHRFEQGRETAIPWTTVHRGDEGMQLWQDHDRDGTPDAGEGIPLMDHVAEAWWCDDACGLWAVDGGRRIVYLPVAGSDPTTGAPRYDPATLRRWSLPKPFTTIRRVLYDAGSGDLFLGGFTQESPLDDDRYHWKAAGTIFARYPGWLAADGAVEPAWQVRPIPDPGRLNLHQFNDIIALAACDGWFFAAHDSGIKIFAIRASDGVIVDTVRAGATVGWDSGLIDAIWGLSARRRKDGGFVLFTEEGCGGKVMIHRWRPPDR